MSKYSEGDKVIIVGRHHGKYYETDAVITSVHPPVILFDYELQTYDAKPLLVYEPDICKASKYYYGLYKEEPLPPLPKTCECGAHKVRGFENFHANYCPLHKD